MTTTRTVDKDSQTFDFLVCKKPRKDAAAEIFAVR
jgi:hypothetical protein